MIIGVYLSLTLPVCCVFAVNAHAPARIRSRLLLLALLLAYVGLILDAKLNNDYGTGLLAVRFTMLLAWLPSIMYVGLLECIWRSIYRNQIRAMEEFDGKRLSNGFAIAGISLFVACVLYFVGGLLSIYI